MLSSPQAFPFFRFAMTLFNSSSENIPVFMGSSSGMIVCIGASVMTGALPSSPWKCPFHFCILSSWLFAFILPCVDFFLPLTSLTTCHAVAAFLLMCALYIWSMCSCMYFWRSVLYVDSSSCWAFLYFEMLARELCLFFIFDISFSFSLFSRISSFSHGTLFFCRFLRGIHFSVASSWAFTKFLYDESVVGDVS